MAGSAMTFTYDEVGNDKTPGTIRKLTVAWTSDDTTGAVSGTTKKLVGEIIKGQTIPSATAAPSLNYDIAITDEQSVNVLGNCSDDLADRHSSNTEEVVFLTTDGTSGIGDHPMVCDKLTIAVTNAGNSKQGQLVLYYRPR